MTFTNLLDLQPAARMTSFDLLFSKFEKEYPGFLKRHIAVDHFCMDCVSDEEYRSCIADLFKANAVSQLYTSFPFPQKPEKEISVIKLKGFPIDFGFLTHHVIAGFKYLELSNQDAQNTQKSGIDHVEFAYIAQPGETNGFEFSELYYFFEKEGFAWKSIKRPSYRFYIYEICDKAGFKLRFSEEEFLINNIVKNEILYAPMY